MTDKHEKYWCRFFIKDTDGSPVSEPYPANLLAYWESHESNGLKEVYCAVVGPLPHRAITAAWPHAFHIEKSPRHHGWMLNPRFKIEAWMSERGFIA